MTDRLSITLQDAQRGHTAWIEAWKWCKAMLLAGHKLSVTVTKATRSTEMNGLLHSRIGDVAKQIEWGGKKQDIDVWKRLLTAAWLRERGEPIELLPAIDGAGVDIVFRQTSKLTGAECAELADFIMAWGDMKGVKWCRASFGADAPPEAFQ